VLRRERPLSKTLVYGPPQGAGGNIEVGLDLDSRTPAARSFDDKLSLAELYFAAHVSVKPGEQAVFTVRAFTSKCYCEWELLIEAVVDGKDQVFPVKDGDQPFRTTAFAKSYETIYSFDFLGEPVRQASARHPVPTSAVRPVMARRRSPAAASPATAKLVTAPLFGTVLSSA
jgi:hypothetical protein